MAVYRELSTNSSVSAAPVAASLCLCLAVAGCNNTGNPVAKFIQADQAQARINTEQARQEALARVAKPTGQKTAALAAQPTSKATVDEKTFRPNLFRMFKRDTVGNPTEFQKPVLVAAAEPTPQPFPTDAPSQQPAKQSLAAETKPASAVASVSGKSTTGLERANTVSVAQEIIAEAPRVVGNGPMAKFRSKLAALKSGTRSKPVTIVHIGDSHVASDSFSQGIRRALQAEFGDAGRGTVVPAGAFKYAFTDQLKQTKSGPWRADTALKNRKGKFGLAGVSVSSASSRAKLKMTTKTGPFDAVTVTVATGPKQGSFIVKVGNTTKKFSAKAGKNGSKTFKVAARGETAVLQPAGGLTRLYSWGTEKSNPGVRYASLGLIGATVDITKRFNKTLVQNDIRALDPDLIVYGYGTNEGFNDNLNIKRYTQYATGYIDSLLAAAPNAEVVIIGAADGLRRRGKKGKACGGGWRVPPKLAPLRAAMKQVAEDRNMGYWDWSVAMGGPCSANKWATSGLAARDRVHLTPKGYRRSAAAFASWLAGDQSKPVKVAANSR